MPYAVRIHEYGGPEVLRVEDVPVPSPGAGELLVRQTAVGLNFIDTYHRTGLYPLPSLPATLGREAAGTVEAVGDGVAGFRKGDRVGYPLFPGAYTDLRVLPADEAVQLPDGVDEATAAASMLKGLTAWYLLRRTYPVSSGETILFHAAAGGVGSIAVQWAKSLGARVIGAVGSAGKAERATALGCDAVVRTDDAGWVDAVRRFAGDAGLPVVYDSVGRDTFLGSLDCLAPRGTMVSFGNSSGPVDPFSPGLLASKGSLYLTRPTLVDYVRDPNEKREAAADLFGRIANGSLRIDVGRRYPLRDAARAHEDLEARRTSGSTLLIP
ncbi:MAG: quinone oxidoreductase [Planctomycetota bacterium]|nr:quinone oxidoreductase [Planctomycetota bacterium]